MYSFFLASTSALNFFSSSAFSFASCLACSASCFNLSFSSAFALASSSLVCTSACLPSNFAIFSLANLVASFLNALMPDPLLSLLRSLNALRLVLTSSAVVPLVASAKPVELFNFPKLAVDLETSVYVPNVPLSDCLISASFKVSPLPFLYANSSSSNLYVSPSFSKVFSASLYIAFVLSTCS